MYGIVFNNKLLLSFWGGIDQQQQQKQQQKQQQEAVMKNRKTCVFGEERGKKNVYTLFYSFSLFLSPDPRERGKICGEVLAQQSPSLSAL